MAITLKLSQHYLKNGLYLAHAAKASYNKRPQSYVNYRFLGLGTPHVFHSSDDSLEDVGFVASSNSHVIVSIRGTDDIEDWRNNLSFGQTVAYGGLVHNGFLTSADAIYDQIVSAIDEAGGQSKKLWLTGHSRGGALAILIAHRLTQDDAAELSPHGVYTYGAPRVGDIDFYHQYALRDRTHLFINGPDPVPDLPPAGITDYVHVDEQHLLTGTSVKRVDVDVFDFRTESFRFPRRFPSHNMVRGYIRTITNRLTS